MAWKVEVLIYSKPAIIVNGIPVPAPEWETAIVANDKQWAEHDAAVMFQHGYSPKAGEHWRVMGTRVTEIEEVPK